MELKELLERAEEIRKSMNEGSRPIRADKNDIDNNSLDYLQGELNELLLEYDETKDVIRRRELEKRILDKADKIAIEIKKKRKEEATLYVDSKKSEIKQKIKELTEQNKKLYAEKSKPLQKRRDDINKRIEEIATDPKRVEELKGLIAERDQVLKENSEILREHFKRQNTIKNLKQELRRLEEIDLENEDDISKVLEEKAEEEEKNKSNIYNLENPEQDGRQPKEPKSGARKVKVVKKVKPVYGPKKVEIPEEPLTELESLPPNPLDGAQVVEPESEVIPEPFVEPEPESLPPNPLDIAQPAEPELEVMPEPFVELESESLPPNPLDIAQPAEPELEVMPEPFVELESEPEPRPEIGELAIEQMSEQDKLKLIREYLGLDETAREEEIIRALENEMSYILYLDAELYFNLSTKTNWSPFGFITMSKSEILHLSDNELNEAIEMMNDARDNFIEKIFCFSYIDPEAYEEICQELGFSIWDDIDMTDLEDKIRRVEYPQRYVNIVKETYNEFMNKVELLKLHKPEVYKQICQEFGIDENLSFDVALGDDELIEAEERLNFINAIEDAYQNYSFEERDDDEYDPFVNFGDNEEVQPEETYGSNDSESYIDMKDKLIALINYVKLDTLGFICNELEISDRLPPVEIAEKILELPKENIERYIKMLEENSRLIDFFGDDDLPIAQEEKGIKAFGKKLLKRAKDLWTKLIEKIGDIIDNIKEYFEGLEKDERRYPDEEYVEQEDDNIFPEGTFRRRRERWIDDSINSQGTVSTEDRTKRNQTTSQSKEQDGQEQRR